MLHKLAKGKWIYCVCLSKMLILLASATCRTLCNTGSMRFQLAASFRFTSKKMIIIYLKTLSQISFYLWAALVPQQMANFVPFSQGSRSLSLPLTSSLSLFYSSLCCSLLYQRAQMEKIRTADWLIWRNGQIWSTMPFSWMKPPRPLNWRSIWESSLYTHRKNTTSVVDLRRDSQWWAHFHDCTRSQCGLYRQKKTKTGSFFPHWINGVKWNRISLS